MKPNWRRGVACAIVVAIVLTDLIFGAWLISIDQPIVGALAIGLIFVFAAFVARSEERRVGKECRSRWSPYH